MSLLESAPHEIAQFIVQRTQPTEQDDYDDDDDDAVIVLQDKSSLLSSNWIAFLLRMSGNGKSSNYLTHNHFNEGNICSCNL